MTKRINPILITAIVLLLPTLILAGTSNEFRVAKAISKADNIVVVPIDITNKVELAALVIPLKFSEGVTLKEVDFEGTRVDYFDLKAARIDNEERTVVIGLLPQFSPAHKPYLAVGEGIVANLVFEIDDASIESVSLEAVELKNPNHSLTFVYHEDGIGSPIKMDYPEFENTEISLSNLNGELPTTFALNQNYPNPFNPTSMIAFDLPAASRVSIDVYNILGQHVINLVDGEMEAGSHIVEFDGSAYSSGVYFYRMNANNFSETKKMVMLK